MNYYLLLVINVEALIITLNFVKPVTFIKQYYFFQNI